jgi:hypothetical protein
MAVDEQLPVPVPNETEFIVGRLMYSLPSTAEPYPQAN